MFERMGEFRFGDQFDRSLSLPLHEMPKMVVFIQGPLPIRFRIGARSQPVV